MTPDEAPENGRNAPAERGAEQPANTREISPDLAGHKAGPGEGILRETREELREMVTGLMITSGPAPDPLIQKLTPQHVATLIEHSEKESKRDHKLLREGRIYTLVYALIAVLAFFGFALMFGHSNPALFTQVLVFLAPFGAGFAAGWGVSTLRNNQPPDD